MCKHTLLNNQMDQRKQLIEQYCQAAVSREWAVVPSMIIEWSIDELKSEIARAEQAEPVPYLSKAEIDQEVERSKQIIYQLIAQQKDEPDNDSYYLLIHRHDPSCLTFVPERDFHTMFLLDSKTNSVYDNGNYRWHPMSGGLDTYMQSYELNHARSNICLGNWLNQQKNIIGCYTYAGHK